MLTISIGIIFLVVSVIAGPNHNENAVSVLGDSIISEKSSSSFFKMIDDNSNGHISVDELKQFVVHTGGQSLDEQGEIQSAVANVLLSLDDNLDKVVKKSDLAKFLVRQASLLSAQDVADWLTHSLHMPPSIVDIFYHKSYTGYDFPELIENNGELIETELEITQPHLKRRLQRGIIMRFTGMGRLPATPTQFNASQYDCNSMKLYWDVSAVSSDSSDFFPVHKFVLQRYVNTNGGKWITLYAERGFEYIDTYSDSTEYSVSGLSSRTYRLAAWNAIGRSDFMMLTTQVQGRNLGSICVEAGNTSANIVAKLTKEISFSGDQLVIPSSLFFGFGFFFSVVSFLVI